MSDRDDAGVHQYIPDKPMNQIVGGVFGIIASSTLLWFALFVAGEIAGRPEMQSIGSKVLAYGVLVIPFAVLWATFVTYTLYGVVRLAKQPSMTEVGA